MSVADNPTRHRFELSENGVLVFCNYRMRDDVVLLTHVEADPALRGSGAAGRLMDGVMATARAAGWKVVPLCGYAAAWLRRHKEHRDLMA